MTNNNRGWYREPYRHSLASRGIKSKKDKVTPINNEKLEQIIDEARKYNSVDGVRVGNFRVRERMNQHDGGRSTGHFGTGLYFYSTTEMTDENYRDEHVSRGNQPVHRVKNICKNPIKLNDHDSMKLHDVGHDMVAYVRDGYPKSLRYSNYVENMTDEEIKEKILDDIDFNLMLIGGFGDESMRRMKVKEALDNTKSCLSSDGYYSRTCTHPINHLLRSYGYDGVYPTGEMGASNSYGCVYFVEDFEENTGYKTSGSKDIPIEVLE